MITALNIPQCNNGESSYRVNASVPIVAKSSEETSEEKVNPNKAIFDILDKSFESLTSSPLLPFNDSAVADEDPLILLNNKETVIRIIMLCFASFAVTFESSPSSSADPTAVVEHQTSKTSTGLDVLMSNIGLNDNGSLTPTSSVSSSSTCGNQRNSTKNPSQFPSARVTDALGAVPCEILFLLWELLVSNSSIEITPDERQIFQQYLSSHPQASSISELAMHVLLSLGLIELIDNAENSTTSPYLRISHELNQSYGIHVSRTKLCSHSDGTPMPRERWNALLAQSLQRINHPSACTTSNSGGVSASDLYALEKLPHHLMMSGPSSYRDVSLILSQENFVNKRLAILGLARGTKRHHLDIVRFYQWATKAETTTQNRHDDLASSAVAQTNTMTLPENNNNIKSVTSVCLVVVNAYNEISKCLFREYETLERMNDTRIHHHDGIDHDEQERLWLQLGEAFHLLGTCYTSLISTKRVTEEQISNFNSTLANPAILESLQEEQMKHYEVALKIKYSYYGENHESVADTYLAIGMAHQTRGNAYKAMACYNNASDMYKACVGPNSLQFSQALFYSGVIYLEARDLETALECLEECLLIRRRAADEYKNKDFLTNSADNADTLQYIGRVYSEMGNSAEALKYFKASLWAKESILGKDHLEVAASYFDMGNLFLFKKEFDAAVQFYQKALSSRRSKLGDDDELVGETISQLARAHNAMGDRTNAIICLNEAIRIEELKKPPSPSSLLVLYDYSLPLLKAQYGPEDETVASALQSMASCHEKLKRVDQAVKFYEDALKIRRKLADHANIAAILCRLGIIYAKNNQYPETLSCFEEALLMRKLTLGDDDVEVANILHNIGNTLVKMQQLEEAKTTYAEVLRIRKMHFGRDHISVGKTLHNMGNIHERLGDLQNSIICFEHALRIRRNHQTEENSLDLSFTLNNLAQAYLKADGNASSERALELLSEALSIRKRKFGECHELVGDTMFYIGRVYDLHGDDQAFQYFHEAKAIFEKTVGKLHSKVAEVHDFLGSMYEARTEYENACEHYEKSLSIKRASFGEDGMPVAETLYNLGCVHAKQGDDDNVLMYYKDALRVMKLHVGKNDLRVGIILNDVGIIQARRGQHEIALKCLQEALRIRKILRGNSHEDIADTLFNIGNVYQDLLDYESSLTYFKEALGMYKFHTGVDSLDVGNTLHQIGDCCRMKNDFELATKYYKDALEIRTLKLGIDDVDVATTLNCLGLMYHGTGNFDAALECYDEAIRIRKSALNEDHLLVADSMFNKGALFALRHDTEQAIECYAECLQIYRSKESYLNVAKALAGLGCLYEAENNLDQAIDTFEEALTIRTDHYGQDHESVAELLLNIGSSHLTIGNYEKSMSVLEEALRILKSFPENENVDILTKTIDTIGRVYDAQSKPDDALICYRESLRVRRRLLGPNHLRVADSFDLMASVYQAKSEFNDAIRCIKEALQIRVENLGGDDIEVGNTLFGMGILCCEAGQYAESVSSYKQALTIRESCLGESSIEVAKTLHNIGSVLALQRDYADALTNWKNALSIYKEAGMDNDDDMVKCALGNIAMAEHLLLEAVPDTGMM